jgi:uncharacterized protein YoxC
MDITLVAASTSTASLVLRYSAAFFFVLVAIALAYVLFKAAKTLERLDKVLVDVDENGIPLMQKAGETLDGVNANLTNVDEITKDVAGITDKIDTMANAVEGAVTTPARKAAAFTAGVQSAVSSFMRRDKGPETADWGGGAAAPGATPADGWSYAAAEAAEAAAEETSAGATDATSSSAEAFAAAEDTMRKAADATADATGEVADVTSDAAGTAADTAGDVAAKAGEAAAGAADEAKGAADALTDAVDSAGKD